jgi:hypothetical protein
MRMKVISDDFFDGDDLWVDDLYDMTEVELRRQIEKYARLARRYPHPTTQNQMAYKYAWLRHNEALKILEARSQ